MAKRDLLAAVVAVEPGCRGRDLCLRVAVEGRSRKAAHGWSLGLRKDSGWQAKACREANHLCGPAGYTGSIVCRLGLHSRVQRLRCTGAGLEAHRINVEQVEPA
jgi:hypothetical protein